MWKTLLLVVALTGCGVSQMEYSPAFALNRAANDAARLAMDKSDHGGSPEAAEGRPAGKETPVPYLTAVDVRKVIYDGRFDMVVGEVGPALAATRKLATDMGGYMQQMTTQSITVRVPAEKFEQATAALEKLGTITRRAVTAQDVTEQYVDLQIRLANAKALNDKLRSLLDKTPDVAAALEVERELARTRTEIEQLQGQLNRLQSQVAMATLTANFTTLPNAPSALRVSLPFAWLKDIGLDRLMAFNAAQ